MRINRDKIRKRELKRIKSRQKKRKKEELSYKLELLRKKLNNELLPSYR